MTITNPNPAQPNTPQPPPGAAGERTSQALWSHLRHELRTPLNAIIGYSEMLLEDADDTSLPDFAADLKQVLAAGRQLLAVVNDLLDAQKLASDDVAFNLESLIANLDYQARAPLNGVIGYSEILLENAAEQGLEKISPTLRRSLPLVSSSRRVLTTLSIFPGLMPVCRVPAPGAPDQSPLVDSVMASLREMARETCCRLRR